MSIVSKVGWWTAVFLSVFILPFPTKLLRHWITHHYYPDVYAEEMIKMNVNTPKIFQLTHIDSTTGATIPRHESYEKAPFIAYIMHFIPVYLWAIAMPLQLSTTIRKSAPSWHRKIGTITLGVSGLLIGISGVLFRFTGVSYQTHDPVGSLAWIFSNHNASTVLAAWFLYATAKGYLAARAKRFDQHRRWMVRYAAAGYSVVVQRVILIIVALVYGFNTEVEERFKRNLFGYLLSIGVALSAVVAELGLWVHSRPTKKSVKTL